MFETDPIQTSAGELEITFIGHGTLMMEFNGKVIHIDPWSQFTDYANLPKADIILIDEALSAGDIHFREKTNAYFHHPDNENRTFVVATHYLPFLESFCSETLWLHQGRMQKYGDTAEIIAEYSQ